MAHRRRFRLKLKSRTLLLGERTLVMGVLNVTPDSFSDGGQYLDADRAAARALEIERVRSLVERTPERLTLWAAEILKWYLGIPSKVEEIERLSA